MQGYKVDNDIQKFVYLRGDFVFFFLLNFSCCFGLFVFIALQFYIDIQEIEGPTLNC